MVEAGVSSPEQPGPILVWSDLATDYRVQAVRLMVQLALKFVAPQVEGRPQEVDDVKPNSQPQSASRAS
jgi:acyl-CoA hydrolase